VPALDDKDIRGLDVSMHDTLRMRGVQSGCARNQANARGGPRLRLSRAAPIQYPRRLTVDDPEVNA
jgi:hypothetical protein